MAYPKIIRDDDRQIKLRSNTHGCEFVNKYIKLVHKCQIE